MKMNFEIKYTLYQNKIKSCASLTLMYTLTCLYYDFSLNIFPCFLAFNFLLLNNFFMTQSQWHTKTE